MRFVIITILVVALSACNVVDREENTILKTVRNPQERIALWRQKIKEQKDQIKNGDLITRTGADVISSTFSNFNKKDKTYSHAGLAFIENNEVYVYHALSGDENPGDKILREKLDSFCNPSRKDGFGVFRYNLSNPENSSLHSVIKKYYQEGLLFDTKFNLKDDGKMYCAEIVLKALKQSTQNRILLPTTNVLNFRVKSAAYQNKTFKQFEYVAIDNLYMNEFCKEIARVKFD